MTVDINEVPEPKLYKCAYCGKMLAHDQVYQHDNYRCPKKPGKVKSPGK